MITTTMIIGRQVDERALAPFPGAAVIQAGRWMPKPARMRWK